MDYVVLGVVLVAVILGIVAAIVGRTTWRAYHIVLAVFLVLVGMTYFYMAARVLQTERNWQKVLADYRTQIKTKQEETQRLVDGDGDPAQSLEALRADVNAVLADRGRAWLGLKPTAVADNGAVTLALTAADPQLVPATRVFAFTDATIEKGGSYLGEFIVAKVEPKKLKLTPAQSLDQRSQERLTAASKGPWSLYEIMPIDSHQAFARVDAKTRQAILPPDLHEEYNRDMTDAKDSDPAERIWIRVEFTKDYQHQLGKETIQFRSGKTAMFDRETAEDLIKNKRVAKEVKKVYVRPLRDYAHLLREVRRQQEESEKALVEVNRQIQNVADAQTKLNNDIKATESLIAELKSDSQHFKRERDEIVGYVKALDSELSETRTKLKNTLAQIRNNANELARLQLEAVERIDRLAPAPAPQASLLSAPVR